MSDLDSILGADWLECCLGELADDQAPTPSEARAQNQVIIDRELQAASKRAQIIAKRPRGVFQRATVRGKSPREVLALARKRLKKNPELGKLNIGRVFKAAATGGISELARSRVGKAIATGGMSEVARAMKGGKKVAGKAAGSLKAALSGAGKAAGHIAEHAAASAGLAGGAHVGGELKIRCIPCDSDAAIAGSVAKKIVPEMVKVRKLLDRMALQTQATSEHNSIKKQRKWRKQAIGLLKQIQEKRCHA